MAFTCKHKHLIVEKYFSDFKFLPQPPFRGLRLVLLFWDGTAWVQEWLPLLGVLLCGCSVMTLWIWFVWCQPHHFMPQIGGVVFIFSWFHGKEGCHFWSLCCLCVDKISMQQLILDIFPLLCLLFYTHSVAFESSCVQSNYCKSHYFKVLL